MIISRTSFLFGRNSMYSGVPKEARSELSRIGSSPGASDSWTQALPWPTPALFEADATVRRSAEAADVSRNHVAMPCRFHRCVLNEHGLIPYCRFIMKPSANRLGLAFASNRAILISSSLCVRGLFKPCSLWYIFGSFCLFTVSWLQDRLVAAKCLAETCQLRRGLALEWFGVATWRWIQTVKQILFQMQRMNLTCRLNLSMNILRMSIFSTFHFPQYHD